MALTDTTIRTAKPKEKPYKLSDDRGLFLLVSPAGGKLWRLKYRIDGKEKLLAIGPYPEISLAQARERREEARKLLTNGVDPSAHKQATKAATASQRANTFEAVAREWYQVNESSWVPTYSIKILSRLERLVFPYLGNRPIADIAAPEMLETLRRIEATGAVESAHRTRNYCSQIFRYAIATGRAERNPAQELLGTLTPSIPKHRAAITNPKQVSELLRAIDGYQGTLAVNCALRLAPLVFVRPGELRAAEWAEIDLQAGEWNIPGERMKMGQPHLVPLSTQAVAILTEIKALTGNERFVFPSARTKGRPMSDNAILAAMRRMGIGKDEMTGHGFRAMARTILDEVLGVRPDFIEHQLAHAVRDPNGRAYNRTAHRAERHAMMQKWADYLDSLKAGAEILPFKKPA